MPGARKLDQLNQSRRIAKIERFIILGLHWREMAERLGVDERTVRRDLRLRMDQMQSETEKSTVSYRNALLTELGQVYAEATKDCSTARSRGDATYPYLSVRTDALKLISRITGAEQPIRVEMAVEHNVNVIPEKQLHELMASIREVESEVRLVGETNATSAAMREVEDELC